MENNTFSPSRFGKYFTHDLFTAKSNYGVSFLLLALLPVIVALISTLFRLIFGHFVDLEARGTSSVVAICAFIAAMISFPSKVYGGITSKSYGSDWVLLPASGLEKFLSMMLMELVVLPVLFCVVMFGSDAIFNLFIPGSDSLIRRFADSVTFSGSKLSVAVRGFWILWCVCTLIFTLGALKFKKNKVALTFLVVWAVSSVLSTLGFLVIDNVSPDGLENFIEKIVDSGEWLNTWVKWAASIFMILLAGGLMTGIYFRIKRIKY